MRKFIDNYRRCIVTVWHAYRILFYKPFTRLGSYSIFSFGDTAMEYFDATEELYGSIHKYMDAHNGECPERLYVSPAFFQWLKQVRVEEMQLKGQDIRTLDLSLFPTEFGSPTVVIDERLSDFEIITE